MTGNPGSIFFVFKAEHFRSEKWTGPKIFSLVRYFELLLTRVSDQGSLEQFL
jgi:hypothetical protein